jgi:hypothetical protein
MCVNFVSVEMGGKNVQKQKYPFWMEANKNRHKGRLWNFIFSISEKGSESWHGKRF